MKVLWITNFVLPAAGEEQSKTLMSGTWLEAMLKGLSEIDEVELHVGMFCKKRQSSCKRNRVYFHWIKAGFQFFSHKPNAGIRSAAGKLLDEISPDIVHIQGTEYPRCEAVVDECKARDIKVAASVQGLISVISRYYLAEVSAVDWLRHSSLRDFIAGYTIPGQAAYYRLRGRYERSMITKLDAVFGRTDWDRAHVGEISSRVQYYHSPEILRPEFYRSIWKQQEEQSLIVGSMRGPLKGLHVVLKALTILRSDYPDIKLRVIGQCLYEPSKMKRKLIKKTYINYISRMIEKLQLHDNIEWLGPCSATQIVEAMKKSSVYVQASSIENSPNSLAEALQLGMPVVASAVGGTGNMVEHGKHGYLYRFGDEVMLAYYVSKLLGSEKLMRDFSEYSLTTASGNIISEREICQNVIDDYRDILSNYYN